MARQRRHHVISLLCVLLVLLATGFVLPATPRHSVSAQAALSVTTLKTEYMVNPIGLDILRPRFSWQLTAAGRGQLQRGYQVLVASSQANLDANIADTWDSGQVTSEQSTLVEYNGSALAARARYYWKVRVWDQNNLASPWSASAFFELGLLGPADWTARWIADAGVSWGDHTIDLDVTIVNDRAGIIFRARDMHNLYMWVRHEA